MGNLPLLGESLHFTGERMIPDESHYITFWEHIYRYRFATRYVKNRRVLDIACGEGYGTAALVKAGALSVIGMDISVDACEHVKNKYGIDARVGDAAHIPLPSRSVDVIVSFETIEHLPEPEEFLEECTRLLTLKGKLIISTPNKEIYNETNQLNEFHVRELRKEEFLVLLNKHFSKLTLFAQQPWSKSWTNWRSLSSSHSPWLRLRGIYRLRQILMQLTCPSFEKVDVYRKNVVDLIQQKDHFLSVLVNPYLVARSTGNEAPVYLVAVADL